VNASEAKENLSALLEDATPVLTYANGQVTESTVGKIVSEALSRL